MSKRRAVILAVTLEGRSQAEVARTYEVSESTVSRWLARYRVEGDVAFESRSRRPLSSPTKISNDTTALIVNLRRELTAMGLDAGPQTIRWHLERHHETTVSISTIRRRLISAGLIEANPKKRPKSSYVRFVADLPNECWQSDFTHWRLANGTDAELLSWLDDHSRYALSVTAHQRVTGPAVVDTFLATGAKQGFPASVLTDNGMVFTTRFAGGRGGRNGFETTLAERGITQKNSRPNHPTTCGKVERFQQTLKQWLRAQPPVRTITELQDQLDGFAQIYNHQRPHTSLKRRTPAVVYELLPKTGPGGTGAGTHHRIRHDRVDTTGSVTLRHNGRLHHIGIGRLHTGTNIIMLINDLDIHVIDATTGETLRHLTLDPTRDYQPTGRPPGPPPKNHKNRTR
jgi:transposase InsO family protein